jgi:hypothetical protein
MIKIGTKVMILGGCVNPDHVGKVGIVTWSGYEGPFEDEFGNEVDSDVIEVVIEGGDPNNMKDVESLYDIHNDFIEVI